MHTLLSQNVVSLTQVYIMLSLLPHNFQATSLTTSIKEVCDLFLYRNAVSKGCAWSLAPCFDG